MKTTIASALFAAFAAMAAQSALATDGTITFTGSVTNTTCTINGQTQGNFSVALPTPSTTDLATTGAVAMPTLFTIALTNCTGSATEVSAYFQPGATINTADGNLTNQAATGGATNVEIQLLNNDQSVIKLGAAVASQNSETVPIATGGANLQYYARYFATGAATAGSVSTTVTYTLNYQ